MLWLLAGLLLLAAAGLRHHLIWGESDRWPWLLPLLNAFELGGVLGFAALAALGWWRAMRAVDGRSVPLRRLVVRTLPILALAMAVPCFLSADPIDYVIRGRVLALHGANPYLHVASEYPGDPFVAFGDAAWKDMPLPYGPVVANLQGAIAWLAHLLPVSPRVELIVALALFKLVFAACLLAAAVALHDVAARVSPGRQAGAFVAIAWNPLLLNECVASAHNEPLMWLCLAVAVSAAIGSRFAIATFALGLGALTKVVPVALGPVWLALAVRRGRLLPCLAGFGVFAGLALGFYWQFFRDHEAFAVFGRQAELSGGSLWWAVGRVFGIGLEWPVRLARVGIALWILLQAGCVWRRPEPRVLLFATASSMFLLAVAGAPLFGVWYHVWWLPFALLLERGFLHRAAVAVSVTGPLAHAVFAGWATARRSGAVVHRDGGRPGAAGVGGARAYSPDGGAERVICARSSSNSAQRRFGRAKYHQCSSRRRPCSAALVGPQRHSSTESVAARTRASATRSRLCSRLSSCPRRSVCPAISWRTSRSLR